MPTVNDTVSEPAEAFTLSVGGVTGTANITDNDSTPTITHVGDGSINNVTVTEGSSAVFTVNLSNPSSTATSFAMSLADGSAVLADDYTNAMVFSNGVTLAGGNISVPAGVTSFTVTVPTVNDTVSEPAEAFTLSVGGVTGTANITDNDSTPTITHVGDGSINNVTVTEGSSAVFTVNLSNPSSTATSFAMSLADGSAVLADDYTNAMVFSNGVTLAGGNISVPAGVTSFTVTVPTVNDTVSEPAEAFTLSVGGVTGTANITDNDSTPTITHVGDGSINNVTVTEGSSAVFTVNLSNPSSTATSFAMSLADGSAVLADDYTNAMVFSNGVTLAGGNISVPAGVTSFTVTVPTVNDTVSEPAEAFTLSVGGVTGTANITDNDSTPTITHVGDGSINNVTVTEGSSAVFTVNLSNPSSTATSFAMSLADGSAVLADDYTNAMVFSNGVTLAGGNISVPAGVTSFTVTVPTVNDTVSEPAEAFTLSVGGVTGTGNITDNDSTPTITHVGDGSINNVTVTEGSSAVFTVNLSNPSSTATSFAMSLADGSAVLADDYTNAMVFSNGVTLAGGNISVPAGVTSFTVTVPTVNDTVSEPAEAFTLSVGGVTGTGKHHRQRQHADHHPRRRRFHQQCHGDRRLQCRVHGQSVESIIHRHVLRHVPGRRLRRAGRRLYECNGFQQRRDPGRRQYQRPGRRHQLHRHRAHRQRYGQRTGRSLHPLGRRRHRHRQHHRQRQHADHHPRRRRHHQQCHGGRGHHCRVHGQSVECHHPPPRPSPCPWPTAPPRWPTTIRMHWFSATA